MSTKAEVVFADEFAYIESEVIRGFVIECFNRFTPEYFWTAPASTTGKYHPEVSLGPGGIVRHTKFAIWWGLEIMQCWPNLFMTAIDEVTAALLLHDLNKNGDKLDAKGFPTIKKSTGVHGPYLSNKISTWLGGKVNEPETEIHYKDPDRIHRILAAIEGHMGIWTDPSYELCKPQYKWSDPTTYDVCSIVHLADYCASRKVDTELEALSYDPSKFEVMFAIGQGDKECGTGFWAGPVPDLETMLCTPGKDENSVIIFMDGINDKEVYRWNPSNSEWTTIE